MSASCRKLSGSSDSISASGWGVRMPATTSSPWAFRRYSPYSSGSPVEGLRVKATPVAESSPMLPNTICTTLTAVPRSSAMWYSRRYVRARGVFHDWNTASIDRDSCTCGSCGNGSPVSAS